jgi:hypothetical protein
MSGFEYDYRSQRVIWINQSLLCWDCSKDRSDEMSRLIKLKTYDLFL